MKKIFTTKNIAVMAVLSAIAYVLYLLPRFIPIFNLPFFPSWLDLQISDLPALLGGFAIHPLAGVIIITVKCLLKMPLSTSACVGELADILVGFAFVLPASLVYHSKKSKKTAILGMLLGAVCATGVACLANRFILIPFYAKLFYGMENIVKEVDALYKGVTVSSFYKYYLLLAVMPFNLLRCLICGVITFFIYKPLSKVLHWER